MSAKWLLVWCGAMFAQPSAYAQEAERAQRDDLIIPAASAAAVGAAAGYFIGTKWRFLGSSPDQSHSREAAVLGLALGGLSSALAACAATDDERVTAKRCLDGALIGVAPAAILAGAIGLKLPRWLKPVLTLTVFGVVEGGFTAWAATRD